MSKEGRDIARHFCDTFELKVTQKQFLMQVGIANSLIKAGYTQFDLINIINYLKEHPPVKGLSSLAYIQYVGNEILARLKVQKLRESQIFFEPSMVEEIKEDNAEKFKLQNKPVIKGQVKF